jgi:hypothetical protein
MTIESPSLFDQLSTMHTRGEAEIRIQEAAPILRERVFGLIAMFGPVTDEQIAELGHLNPSTARPRRLELERAGRIEAAGYSRTKSGRRAVAWACAKP